MFCNNGTFDIFPVYGEKQVKAEIQERFQLLNLKKKLQSIVENVCNKIIEKNASRVFFELTSYGSILFNKVFDIPLFLLIMFFGEELIEIVINFAQNYANFYVISSIKFFQGSYAIWP